MTISLELPIFSLIIHDRILDMIFNPNLFQLILYSISSMHTNTGIVTLIFKLIVLENGYLIPVLLEVIPGLQVYPQAK